MTSVSTSIIRVLGKTDSWNDLFMEPYLRFRAISLIVLALSFTFGCDRVEGPSGSSDQPRVVASFFPLYDFAKVLGGADFNVVCLTPPGGDPHSMDVSPRTAQAVADAQLVLLLGFGLDSWVEKLAASQPQVRLCIASQGLTPRSVEKAALAEFATTIKSHKGDDTEHDANEVDPHVWLDPLIAQQIVGRIAEELVAIAPQHRESVFKRRDAFLGELVKLHEAFETTLEDVPRREVVTFHGAFAYLFARYQLETVGVVEHFPGDEPSANYLRQLVDLMRSLRMSVIFAEPQLPDRPAQVIAREIGGRVERLDPCETILPDLPQASYLERQRTNLETLRRVLSDS